MSNDNICDLCKEPIVGSVWTSSVKAGVYHDECASRLEATSAGGLADYMAFMDDVREYAKSGLL